MSLNTPVEFGNKVCLNEYDTCVLIIDNETFVAIL